MALWNSLGRSTFRGVVVSIDLSCFPFQATLSTFSSNPFPLSETEASRPIISSYIVAGPLEGVHAETYIYTNTRTSSPSIRYFTEYRRLLLDASLKLNNTVNGQWLCSLILIHCSLPFGAVCHTLFLSFFQTGLESWPSSLWYPYFRKALQQI